MKWYRLAAEQDDVSAQNNLGGMYQNGEGGNKEDKEEETTTRLGPVSYTHLTLPTSDLV